MKGQAMKVTASVIGADVSELYWSPEAREQLAAQLPGVEVRDRIGSKVCQDDRGTERDTDPIVGKVVSAAVVGGEVIATLKLQDGIDYGGSVGISAHGLQDGERIEGIERVDCVGLDYDPESCSWGEVLG